MRILGIETSCDETSAAIIASQGKTITLEAHTIASQVAWHAPYGGVVPELAARKHAEAIIPLIHETLTQANVTSKHIDALAVTKGPGLVTALQVGVETAKLLAAAWRKPLIPVNHIAGHLVSPFLTPSWRKLAGKQTIFPAIALVVSGGHTELYLMKSITSYRCIGKTLDDAAGEAFDKVAKMLKLGYPGGPQVSKLAAVGSTTAYTFPRPLLTRSDYSFSFAGLKTAVLYTLQKLPSISPKTKRDICASFEQAAIDVLTGKTIAAAAKHQAKAILVSGGVSANRALRETLAHRAAAQLPHIPVAFPELAYTGDNAAMVTLAALEQAQLHGLKRYQHMWQKISADANWELW